MAYNIVPLTSDPDQSFSCTIPVDTKNIRLLFRFRYNTVAKYWWMTVSNAVTNEMILDSIPLVTGDYPSANILEQYQYLGIGSAVIVKTGQLENGIPDDTNLGTEYVLVWGDTDVV